MPDLDRLLSNLDRLRRESESISTQHLVLSEQKDSYLTKINDSGIRKVQLLKAQQVLDQTILKVSESGINKIESLVTHGLSLTFPDKLLRFRVDRKATAKGNSYQFVLEEQHKDLKDPVDGPIMDTFGGGVVNVVQFLLRVIMIQRFGLAKFMVLDECFNNVSSQYVPAVSSLLRRLCDDRGFNIFLITQNHNLAAASDRVYEVSPGPSMRLWEDDELDELKANADEIARRNSREAEGADSPGSPQVV